MRRVAAIIMLAALSAWICSDAAYARMSDEECAEHVAQECGPIPFVRCFDDPDMWDKINPACTAYVQTNLENAREAQQPNHSEPQEQDYGSNIPSAVNQFGFSYGGQLRRGPGMEFAQQASIQKGDQVEVLEDTSVWMDGYKWFKVRTPRGTGYHWGGIFCITGDQLPEGVLDNCQMLNSEN